VRQDLGDAAAAVVANQIDAIDAERVEQLGQSLRLAGEQSVGAACFRRAPWQSRSGAMQRRTSVTRRWCPPDIGVEKDTVDEERGRTRAAIGEANRSGWCLDRAAGQSAAVVRCRHATSFAGRRRRDVGIECSAHAIGDEPHLRAGAIATATRRAQRRCRRATRVAFLQRGRKCCGGLTKRQSAPSLYSGEALRGTAAAAPLRREGGVA
jgi:hypothetical protein